MGEKIIPTIYKEVSDINNCEEKIKSQSIYTIKIQDELWFHQDGIQMDKYVL